MGKTFGFNTSDSFWGGLYWLIITIRLHTVRLPEYTEHFRSQFPEPSDEAEVEEKDELRVLDSNTLLVTIAAIVGLGFTPYTHDRLGTRVKVTGEKAMSALLEGLDDIKKEKSKNDMHLRRQLLLENRPSSKARKSLKKVSTNTVAPFFQKSGKKLSNTSLLAKLLSPNLLNLISENLTAAIVKLLPFDLPHTFKRFHHLENQRHDQYQYKERAGDALTAFSETIAYDQCVKMDSYGVWNSSSSSARIY
ncbi:9743_t:CDS:10 [Funneliformis mosseae]|uniref:9743_t:CDS:1 n=1 Tax=Funneliformis mosseae TaxID=27381 RepID=A0A9N9CK27_FUNMO|nr:9743_t:CDS:10 [Funneliformis mosseae]